MKDICIPFFMIRLKMYTMEFKLSYGFVVCFSYCRAMDTCRVYRTGLTSTLRYQGVSVRKLTIIAIYFSLSSTSHSQIQTSKVCDYQT